MMAKDGIGEWYDANLRPIFANVVDTLAVSNTDFVILHPIVHGFIKNTVALLESLKGHLRSYPVAQGMRLLMEFEADLDFLIRNPKNIPRAMKKVEKHRKDFVDKKKTWKETIIDSGNMHFLDDATGEEIYTVPRVERCFDKKIYAFYCAYSHFNLYAICDDDENVITLKDIRKACRQKAELIEFYPVILDKFIDSLNVALGEENKITYDADEFKKKFEVLLIAIANVRIKEPENV